VRELLLQRTGRVEWEGVLQLRFEDDQFDLVQLQRREREVLVRQVLLERPQETAQGTEGARARKGGRKDDGSDGGGEEEEVSEKKKKKKKKTLEVTTTRRRSKIGEGERETKREERKKFERRLNESERTENEALGRSVYLFFNKHTLVHTCTHILSSASERKI
jgi:hypothetical protein